MNAPVENRTARRHTSATKTVLVNIAGFVAVIMWGLSFISTKILLENGMGPVEIYIYRFVIAYFLIVLISHKRWMSHSWRDEGLFALCGLTSGALYFIAENTALEYTLVQNVSLLTALSPLITAMLVGLLYANERPGSGMIIGSVIAFAGVVCVILNGASSLEVHPIGDLLSIAAAFSWSVYSLILRRLSANYDSWFMTRKTFFYGIICALPFLFFSHTLSNPLDLVHNTDVVVNLLFLGLGASLIGYLLWSVTVKYLGAVKANNFMYFQMIVTLIASNLILGEAITWIGVFGCALIIGGLIAGDVLTRRSVQKSNS
ncbi:MAG: DMT family transporter [Muribaculaceae bacterium]|nr:DMT family transporter [Muribaculaceae bacterium]